jgi:hypothetical protein
MTTTASGCVWFQRVITLPAVRRGCHYITKELSAQMADCLSKISVGVMHVTSACARTRMALVLQSNTLPPVFV